MSLADTDTILRRIRGLLDQAENTPFPDEAEAFAAKAAELMARYRIDQAMVAPTTRDPRQVVEDTIDLGRGQYVRARLDLLWAVADAFDCRLLTSSSASGRMGHLIGHPDDVAQVSMLYTSLLLQATRAADREATPRGHNRITFRRGFLMGFAHRVGQRLAAQMAAAVQDTEPEPTSQGDRSVAVVLADRRSTADRFVDENYGRLRRLSQAAPVSLDASIRGEAAGDQADLGGRAVPDAKTALNR